MFQTVTEDVSAQGCQLIGPRAVQTGERVQLELSSDLVIGVLRLAGRIAWTTPVEPWRLGVAFDSPDLPRARVWFERLVASHPGLGAFRRVPDRIAVEARVFLGPPPRLLADFSRDEVALLRRVGDGAQVHELLSSFGARWESLQRSFFSLLTQQHLTLLARVAVPASSWTGVLDEAERALPPEPAQAPEPERSTAPSPGPARPDASSPLPAAAPILGTQPAPPPAAKPDLAAGLEGGARQPRRAPDFVGAGVGWHGSVPRSRPAEAQRCLELARAEADAGRVNGALALLRHALALAPGDPEIAAALGQLAFKGRST